MGLYDYDARLYSPLLARFISPDSLVPDKKNVLDFNRYAYVRHNPMRYTDPTGHEPKTDNCSYAGVDCGPVYDLIQAGMQAPVANFIAPIVPQFFMPTLINLIRRGNIAFKGIRQSSQVQEILLRATLPSASLEKTFDGRLGPNMGFQLSVGVQGNNPLSYFSFNLAISNSRLVLDTLSWEIAGVQYALGPQEFSLTLSNPFNVELPGGYSTTTQLIYPAFVEFEGKMRTASGTNSTISGDRLSTSGLYELSVNVSVLYVPLLDPVMPPLPITR